MNEDEVSEVLTKAWAAVEAASLDDDDIRAVAFREAVRLLAPPVPTARPTRPATRQDIVDSRGDAEAFPPEDLIYDRVVAQTGVDREKLEQIVHLDDDGLRISISGLKLGKNVSKRAQAVAQILTVVRGFGFEESDTPLEVIRDECDRLRVYDSGNFSSHMKAMSGFVVTGTGTNRKMRAKSAGIAAFPALITDLLEAE